MSAAATAAGYLYASGRLRGRNAREEEHAQPHEPEPRAKPAKRREVRVAVYPEPRQAAPAPVERPKTQPKIQYRTRRWKPE
jgi:hypothetical protein